MSVFSQLMMKKRGSKIFINPKLVAVGNGITIDKGIATSSDNSYLKIDYIFDINHYNTWKFKTKVYFKSLKGNIFANINQDQVGFRIGTDSDRNRYYMLISIASGNWNRNVSSPNNSAVTNVWTWIEAEYTGSNYILRTSTDGETWTEQINVSMGTKASNGASSVYGFFGSGIQGSTEFLNGYIDLLETKLYANGELWFECANDTGIFGKVLDYIQSTGTQRIDTLIPKETNIKAKLIVQSQNDSGNTVILGYGTKGGQWFGTNNAYYGIGGGQVFSYGSNTKVEADITILYQDSISVTIGNETKTRNYVSSSGADNDKYSLFNMEGLYPASCKIFSCKIWDYDTNELLRNYIPIRRTTDNALGLLDLTNGQFFANAGTGTFIGSDE